MDAKEAPREARLAATEAERRSKRAPAPAPRARRRSSSLTSRAACSCSTAASRPRATPSLSSPELSCEEDARVNARSEGTRDKDGLPRFGAKNAAPEANEDLSARGRGTRGRQGHVCSRGGGGGCGADLLGEAEAPSGRGRAQLVAAAAAAAAAAVPSSSFGGVGGGLGGEVLLALLPRLDGVHPVVEVAGGLPHADAAVPKRPPHVRGRRGVPAVEGAPRRREGPVFLGRGRRCGRSGEKGGWSSLSPSKEGGGEHQSRFPLSGPPWQTRPPRR